MKKLLLMLPEMLLVAGFVALSVGVFMHYGLPISLMFSGGFLVFLAFVIRLTGRN